MKGPFEKQVSAGTMVCDAMGKSLEPGVSICPTRIFNLCQSDASALLTLCVDCFFRDFDKDEVGICTGPLAYAATPDYWFCAAGKPKEERCADQKG